MDQAQVAQQPPPSQPTNDFKGEFVHPVVSANKGTASSLLLEEYTRTHIAKNPLKGGGRHSRPDAKFLPKSSESPFGSFPNEFKVRSMKPQTESSESTSTKDMGLVGSKMLSSRTSMEKTERGTFAWNPKNVGTGGASSSLREGKKPTPPPKPVAGAMERRSIPDTQFRKFYERGDLPISIKHEGTNEIHWKVKAEKLDYHHYLPIFFDGLREKEEPYRFLAVQGTFDLLKYGKDKIVNCIPQLIIPIKTALNTRDPEIICTVLKVIQQLVLSNNKVGEALVPYYRQILPIFNLFKTQNINLGDAIEYSQRKRLNIGDLIEETLQLLEQEGGEDAFINIKYMIPTYESSVLN
ncbi:hypothetical protein C9374_005833 [Naegleria lovaniensis]|uniref:Parkin co-regulated protein n=1 Tax=Naegleria lovaniensis TaxID=51637 RepID=A0AA88KN05_NAELO|nr:uncharacterized protein C9374_005833 [Naegleria lovaniensis]KAG2382041.1 hypothetical protein C9374_005833 [Naegleria lovaniensis]